VGIESSLRHFNGLGNSAPVESNLRTHAYAHVLTTARKTTLYIIMTWAQVTGFHTIHRYDAVASADYDRIESKLRNCSFAPFRLTLLDTKEYRGITLTSLIMKLLSSEESLGGEIRKNIIPDHPYMFVSESHI